MSHEIVKAPGKVIDASSKLRPNFQAGGQISMESQIIEGGRDTRLWHFLSRRGPNSHLVAPQSIQTMLLQLKSKPAYSHEPVLRAPPQSKDIYLWDVDFQVLQDAKARFPQHRIVGIFADVWPALASKTDVLHPVDGSSKLHYAVICLPRSGSTYFCDLLELAGLGQPGEHVRQLFQALLASGKSAAELMEPFVRRTARNGVFGTKLISHFLFGSAGRLHDAEPKERKKPGDAVARSLTPWMKERGFHVIYLKRDPVDQAVSAYFAQETATWHLRGDEIDESKYVEVEYDFCRLAKFYGTMRSGDVRCEAFTWKFPRRLTLCYSDLESDPAQTLREIAKFLDCEQIALDVDLGKTTKKISGKIARMGEFRKRLAADLGLADSRDARTGAVQYGVRPTVS